MHFGGVSVLQGIGRCYPQDMKSKRKEPSDISDKKDEAWEQPQSRDLRILNEYADEFNAEAEDTLTYQTLDF